jgi:hypothetical protein
VCVCVCVCFCVSLCVCMCFDVVGLSWGESSIWVERVCDCTCSTHVNDVARSCSFTSFITHSCFTVQSNDALKTVNVPVLTTVEGFFKIYVRRVWTCCVCVFVLRCRWFELGSVSYMRGACL